MEERRRPGRKRSEETRLAVLTAAYELFGEIGYAAMTIEGIAARAGAGKQTIYRWWPGKADVLLDTLATKADMHVPDPRGAGYREELRAFLADSYALSRVPQVREILCALMAEAQTDPAFGERFRAAFLDRRRDALRTVLDRAAARGDLPATPSPEVALDVVFGVIWYRLLATRAAFDDALADELVAVLS